MGAAFRQQNNPVLLTGGAAAVRVRCRVIITRYLCQSCPLCPSAEGNNINPNMLCNKMPILLLVVKCLQSKYT